MGGKHPEMLGFYWVYHKNAQISRNSQMVDILEKHQFFMALMDRFGTQSVDYGDIIGDDFVQRWCHFESPWGNLSTTRLLGKNGSEKGWKPQPSANWNPQIPKYSRFITKQGCLGGCL